MTITLEELVKLTREEQKKSLGELTTQGFVKLVGSLIEKAKQNQIPLGVLPNVLKTISPTRAPDKDVDDKNKRGFFRGNFSCVDFLLRHFRTPSVYDFV